MIIAVDSVTADFSVKCRAHLRRGAAEDD